MPHAFSHSLFISVAETFSFAASIFFDFVGFHLQDLT